MRIYIFVESMLCYIQCFAKIRTILICLEPCFNERPAIVVSVLAFLQMQCSNTSLFLFMSVYLSSMKKNMCVTSLFAYSNINSLYYQ